MAKYMTSLTVGVPDAGCLEAEAAYHRDSRPPVAMIRGRLPSRFEAMRKQQHCGHALVFHRMTHAVVSCVAVAASFPGPGGQDHDTARMRGSLVLRRRRLAS